MSSMAIIKQLDVFKDSLSSLSSIGIFFMMGTFGFETVEKAFRNSIIPTVSATAHATNHLVIF